MLRLSELPPGLASMVCPDFGVRLGHDRPELLAHLLLELRVEFVSCGVLAKSPIA